MTTESNSPVPESAAEAGSASTKQELGRRLFSNALFSIIGRFAGLIVGVVSSPILLDCLGTEGFALFALALAIAFHLNILSEFGSSLALIYHLAKHRETDEVEQIRRIWGAHLLTALASTALKCLLIGLVFVLASSIIDSELSQFLPIYEYLLLIFVISATRPFLLAFECFFQGFEDFVPLGFVQFFRAVLWLLMVFGIQYFHYGLREILIADIVLSLLVSAFGWTLLLRKYDLWQQLLPKWPGIAQLRVHFAYGLKIYVSQCSDLTQNYSDKLVLGAQNLQLKSFELGQKLNLQAHSLLTIIAGIAPPTIAKLHKKQDTQTIQHIFAVLQKGLSLLAALGYGIMFVTAPWLLGLWLGPEKVDEVLVLTLRCFAVQAFILSTTIGPIQVARGLGQLNTEALGMFVVSVGGFLLRFYCYQSLGYAGLLYSSVIVSLVLSVFLIYRYACEWEFSILATIWRGQGLALIASVIAMVLCAWLLPMHETLELQSRFQCLRPTFTHAGAYCGCFVAVYLLFGGYDSVAESIVHQFRQMLRARTTHSK